MVPRMLIGIYLVTVSSIQITLWAVEGSLSSLMCAVNFVVTIPVPVLTTPYALLGSLQNHKLIGVQRWLPCSLRSPLPRRSLRRELFWLQFETWWEALWVSNWRGPRNPVVTEDARTNFGWVRSAGFSHWRKTDAIVSYSTDLAK